MNSTDSQNQNGSPQTPHHRRSREEVEALAKNFVATPVGEVPPSKKGRMAMIGGGVALALVVITVLAWPKRQVQRDTSAADAAAAAAEAEQWKARLEAEKERKRKELEAGSDYLERIAASDAELLKDMTSRAEKLASRAAAFADEPDTPPTPRESTTTAAKATAPTTTLAAAPKPAPTTTAPATTTTTTQQKPAEQPATKPATKPAAPAQAPTQVAAASCSIHVSELSSSGKLTYEDVKKMKGARLDEDTGSVFTPPVQAAGGRTVIFEVLPTGCVNVKRRAKIGRESLGR